MLQKVISILGDAEKRADDDAPVGEAAHDLQEYFKTWYKKIKSTSKHGTKRLEADIEEFEAKYRGSYPEENYLKDLNGLVHLIFLKL